MRTAPHILHRLRLGAVLCAFVISFISPSQVVGYFSAQASNTVTLSTGDWVPPEIFFQVKAQGSAIHIYERVQLQNFEWGHSHEFRLQPLSSIELESLVLEQNSVDSEITSWLYIQVDVQKTAAEYVEPTLRITDSQGILLERVIPNESAQSAEFIIPVQYTFEEMLQEQVLSMQIISDFTEDPGFRANVMAATTEVAALNSITSELFVAARDISPVTMRCWNQSGEELNIVLDANVIAQILPIPLGRSRVFCQAMDASGHQSTVASLWIENLVAISESAPSISSTEEGDGEWLVSTPGVNLSDPWYGYKFYSVPTEGDGKTLSAMKFLPSSQFDALSTTLPKETSSSWHVFSDQAVALVAPQEVSGGSMILQVIDAAGNSQDSTIAFTAQNFDRLSSISISEVMWMGSPLSTADEWVELRNSSDEVIDISGWQVAGLGAAGSSITIPTGTSIPPFAYLVLARYQPGGTDTLLKSISHWLTAPISIANDNEALELLTSDGILVDSVVFAEWPAGSNQLPKRSMQRREFFSNGSDAGSWYTCSSLECESVQPSLWTQAGVYGTPGLINR